MFSSSSDPFQARMAAMAITAAGYVAAIVMPARKPEIGIGRAENHRHHETQQHCAPGKLAHFHVLRDIGLEFLQVLDRIRRACLTHDAESSGV